MIRQKKISEEMIELLSGRAGFDEWWESIDEETKKEIIDEMDAVYLKWLCKNRSVDLMAFSHISKF